jgi:hypothetical protein
MFKRIGLWACLCLAVLGLNGVAATQGHAQQQPQQSARGVTTGSTALIEQGSYINREGHSVHRPAHTVSGAAPAGATAQCRDASYSFSENHRGACSRHGGVSRWL